MNLISYFLAFFVPFLVSFFLAPFFIDLAHRFRLLDYPTADRKLHKKPTPNIGGVVLFITFWATIVLGFFITSYFQDLNTALHLPALFHQPKSWFEKITWVFAGSLLITIIGFIDDRLRLNPLPKLIVQAISALILLNLGLQVNLVQQLGFIGFTITFVWILLLLNAFNFIDSIDGHCLGIAFISSLFFFAITLIVHQSAISLLVLVFSGTLGGLLPYNFKPARTFLGDSGSLFIGFMLSVITLLCRYNSTPVSEITPLIPILLFGVPIYDMLSVIIVRTFRGIPPWKGDRNHLAHRLVKLGMGEKNAALFSYFIAVTLGLIALLTTQIDTPLGSVLVILIFFSIIAIIARLEFYAAAQIRLMEERAAMRQRLFGESQKAD